MELICFCSNFSITEDKIILTLLHFRVFPDQLNAFLVLTLGGAAVLSKTACPQITIKNNK